MAGPGGPGSFYDENMPVSPDIRGWSAPERAGDMTMHNVIKTFGIKEYNRSSSEIDLKVEELQIAGFTVLADVLSAETLALARGKLDEIYKLQLEEIGGFDNLKLIGDPYTAMCPLAYDELFLSLVTERRILDIVERLLGDYFIVMLQNGILNVPEVGDDQTSGYWHRDLGYQHFVSSRPIGLTAVHCLDDFNAVTGGTRVLPGSHRQEAFPSEEFLRRHEIGVEAPAGSVVLLDPMLYHRGGHNTSPNVRRGINTTYTIPLIKQQLNLPQALGGRYRDDPFLARLLGYESEVDPSVLAFRQRRLQRKLASPAAKK
jgi:ectoine hydroxylase-related dioxygenase (phytanoyl-CoA dioxygenase family)